jgi:hypothetical protein
VRRASLLGEGASDRKLWIDSDLKEVTQRLGLRRAVNLGGCLVT